MKKTNGFLTKILSLLMLVFMGFGAMSFTKTNTVYASAAEEHDHSSWQNWGDEDSEKTSLPSESGDYILTSDITLSETWSVPEGETKLCLNGYVINAGGGNYGAFSITTGATLNLFDCGSRVHYFNEDDFGLWKLADDQSIPTDYFVNGGCVTGASGAISCTGTGIFNMYGGNIVGNKAPIGGGIYNTSKFYMYGGTIIGNQADESGGGLYSTSLAVAVLAGGEITKNTANSGSGVFYKTEECFVAGTLITMADGTKQAIEDLSVGDLVRVFDHNSGLLSSSKLFDVGSMYLKQSGVVNLHFSNDIDISVVYGHSFFERDLNRYVPITKDNVSEYVGHQFYNADNACWETLLDYDFVEGEADTYIIASEYNLNCIANGMLSVEDGLYTALSNTFEFDENLTIDQVKKDQDIEKYGIYEFENLKYINRHTYEALGLENLNVTFGKDLFLKEKFEFLEYISATYDPEIYCDVNEKTKPKPRMLLKNAINEIPVDAPTTAGLYVGGSIKIIDNAVDNLYLPASEMVIIGTGTTGDGKGVPSPTEDMLIGITLQSEVGRFINESIIDYSANFFSDSEDCAVRINDGGTDDNPSDDFLELVYVYVITNNTKEADKALNYGYIEVTETAIKDEEVSVTVYLNQGYKLSSLVFNDGTQDYDITSTKCFTMPEGAVSITATFEEKAEQVVTIVLEEKFIYPNTPYITEKQTYSTSNYYEKLGDGVVTVEYKAKGADDSEYTTGVPTEYGEYTLRVSVAEGSEYQAGFATKDFIYSPQVITQVGFGNLQQPVAGAVVPEKTGGMLVNTKYSETLTWDPEISTVNEDGNKIFGCDTTYTAIVTLTIKVSFADNYVFAEEPTLKGAGSGWVLSEDSTDKMLIYTKEFEPTGTHSVNKVSGTVTCTSDGYKDAYLCEICGLYYEDDTCIDLIGDLIAYEDWKLADGKASATGHDMTHHSALAATCTENGIVEHWTCSHESGVYYSDAQGTATLSSVVAPAIGHYMIHHSAVDPSCTVDGNIEHWTCSHESGVYYVDEQRSATLETVVIDKLGHNLVHHDAKDPSCIEVGWDAYDTCSRCDYSTYNEIPATGHTYGTPTESWDGDKVTLTVTCSCGDNQTDDFTGTYEKVSDATCTTKEKGKYVVTIENGIFTGTYESDQFERGEALGHDITKVNGQSPTCTEDGTVEYWTCSRESGLYYADEQGTSILTSIVDPKLGHDIIHHDAKAPTCIEVGWEAYDTCSRCDYSTYVEIQALGHSLSEVAGKSPTCTEDGYLVAYKCSTCEMYFTDPAGEHEIGNESAYNAWKLNEGKIQARHVVSKVSGVDPTKERSGYKEAWKCSECGQYFEDEACTVLIGDETAYNAWKSARGYLPQLPSEGLSACAIVGICIGSFLFLLVAVYLIGYFFLYRKGKLDEKKIKVIYKILPRGEYNLKEDKK